MEYKKKKPTLESLRTGRPTLNNAAPAEWLIRAIGSDYAKAAIMFDAVAWEGSGITYRFRN